MRSGRFANLELDGDGSSEGAVPAEAGGPPPSATELRDAQYYLREAVERELAGEYEAALRSYSVALGEDPLALDAWAGQVWMLLQLEEYPEARLWADKALESFPDNPHLVALKSIALYRMGECGEARELNSAALGRKGQSTWVWLGRGEIMLADDRAAAEDCFKHAARVASQQGLALLRAATVYLRYRHYSRAMSTLQEVTSASPRLGWAWYLLGRAQEQLGLIDQAQLSYGQAVGSCPQRSLYREAAHNAKTRRGGLIRRLAMKVFGK